MGLKTSLRSQKKLSKDRGSEDDVKRGGRVISEHLREQYE